MADSPRDESQTPDFRRDAQDYADTMHYQDARQPQYGAAFGDLTEYQQGEDSENEPEPCLALIHRHTEQAYAEKSPQGSPVVEVDSDGPSEGEEVPGLKCKRGGAELLEDGSSQQARWS